MNRAIRGVLAVGLLQVGCAGGSSGGGARFPSRAELRKIEEGPAPGRLVNEKVIEVDGWTLTGPLPDAIEVTAHQPANDFERLLATAGEKRHGLTFLSESAHCLARELGHFRLRHAGSPADRLRRFAAARCGLPSAAVSTSFLEQKIPDSVKDEEVFSRWREQLEKMLSGETGGGARLAGLWFGRDQGKAVAVLASVPRKVDLERTALAPDADGRVILRGELLEPADRVVALINVGEHGFRECAADPGVRAPHFSVSCQTDAQDRTARIELAAFPAGRILGRAVVDTIVWPSGPPAAEWTRPAHDDLGAVAVDAPVSDRLTAMINHVRRDAGLKPVELSASESRTAEKIAPHYFAALAGNEPETVADRVALGVRAGWDVEETVRFGHFAADLVQHTLDPAELLGAALERPSVRETLLDPAVRKIAIGSVMASEEQILAAVVGSYALFEEGESAVDAPRVLGKLTALRQLRKLPDPFVHNELRVESERVALEIAAGKATPRQALDRMVERASVRMSGPVRGWVAECSSLADLVLPPELIANRSLRLSISVAQYRSPDEPWGRYVVLLLADGAGDSI